MSDAAIVLYAGDPRAAVEGVARDTGRERWLLEPARLSEVTGDLTPELIGAAPRPACDAPSRSAAVFAALSRAEPHVAAAAWEAARAELAAGVAAVSCLGDPVEASIAARLFLLDGVTRATTGDAAGARRSYQQALAFQPGMAWDAALPADARVPFDPLAQEVPVSAHVALGAGFGDSASVFVDGRPAVAGNGGLEVSAGPHVLQVIAPTITTMPFDALPGASLMLVAPAPLSDDAVTRTADPAVRAAIDATIAQSFADRPVYVWTGSTVIDASNGWNAVPGVRPPSHVGSNLILGGAIVAGVGLVGTSYGLATFYPNVNPPPNETEPEMIDRFISGGRAGGVASIGAVVLLEGLVAIGVGIPIAIIERKSRVRVAVMPGGVTVGVGP